MPIIRIQNPDNSNIQINCRKVNTSDRLGTRLHGIYWLKQRGMKVTPKNLDYFMRNRNEMITLKWISFAKHSIEFFAQGHNSVVINMRDDIMMENTLKMMQIFKPTDIMPKECFVEI